MFKPLFAAMIFAGLQAGVAKAVPVEVGETIRGSYSFATVGAPELEPRSFLLRLSSADLFGNGDALRISLLDSSLTPLSQTAFTSAGSGLDPTVGILITRSDFLPGVLGRDDPARIPSAGVVEITALAGSFDVSALDIFGFEPTGGPGIFRQTRVNTFEATPNAPAPVPLPASVLLLIGASLSLRCVARS